MHVRFLVDALDQLDFLWSQLHELHKTSLSTSVSRRVKYQDAYSEICLHALDVLALNDRRRAPLDEPADDDLSRRNAVCLGNFFKVRVVEEHRISLPCVSPFEH